MHWIVLVYLSLLALNVWLLWFLPAAAPIEKVSFMLAIVGIYSLALNFSTATGLSQADPSWLDQLTSPSLRDFVVGSFRVAGFAWLFGSLFIRGFPPPVLSRLRLLALLLAIPLFLGTAAAAVIVTAAYLAVIAPVAYVAYLLASIILGAVENAPDEALTSREERELKAAVGDHRVQLRTLAVGVPATVLGIGTTAYSFFP
jgi:hypothetical protein